MESVKPFKKFFKAIDQKYWMPPEDTVEDLIEDVRRSNRWFQVTQKIIFQKKATKRWPKKNGQKDDQSGQFFKEA